MLRDMKALIHYFIADYRFSFIVFFSIMSASLAGFTIVSIFMEGTDIIVFTGPIVLIFAAISGFYMTKETFPFCIRLGITRGRYVAGAGIFILLLSLALSTVHFVLNRIFSAILEVSNYTSITHYTMLNLLHLENTVLNEIGLLAAFSFLVLSVSFLLGSIFYRYGMVGGFITLSVLFIILAAPATRQPLIDMFLIVQESAIEFRYWALLLFPLLAFLPNWTLLRKATTIAARAR
ncbi:hypothetical protein ACFFGV_00240 [Pontibacillus salicampi]|uniref:DUF4052 domain-containing protein n=1 Tax=Pontibacillus salicampi TaxID=1449801 RepID=A0ABV6LI40_9BACI